MLKNTIKGNGQMKIKLQMRMVYGRPLYYPMCPISKNLSLLGHNDDLVHTFSLSDIKLLKEAGFQIELIPYIVGGENERP